MTTVTTDPLADRLRKMRAGRQSAVRDPLADRLRAMRAGRVILREEAAVPRPTIQDAYRGAFETAEPTARPSVGFVGTAGLGTIAGTAEAIGGTARLAESGAQFSRDATPVARGIGGALVGRAVDFAQNPVRAWMGDRPNERELASAGFNSPTGPTPIADVVQAGAGAVGGSARAITTDIDAAVPDASKPYSAAWFAYNGGKMVPQVAASLGATAVGTAVGGPVGGLAAGAAVTFPLEAGQHAETVYQDLRAKGVSHEDALTQAFVPSVAVGLVNAGIEQLGVERLVRSGKLFKGVKAALFGAVKSGASEGLQEVAQGDVGRVARSLQTGEGAGLMSRDAWSQRGQEFTLGGIFGLPGGAFATHGDVPTPEPDLGAFTSNAQEVPRGTATEPVGSAVPHKEGGPKPEPMAQTVPGPTGTPAKQQAGVTHPGRHTTVPETVETLKTQVEMVQSGQRRAMLVTPGATMPVVPGGLKSVQTKAGTFIYDPNRMKPAVLKQAVIEDRIGEVLEYGIARKPEPGTEAGTVVVRDGDGREVQAVVTDAENLPAVMAAAERLKRPGDTVAVEDPTRVVTDRIKENANAEVEGADGEVSAGVPAAAVPTQGDAPSPDAAPVGVRPTEDAPAAEEVRLYRGVPRGGDAKKPGVGGALFYSPDRAIAEAYAGAGGVVSERLSDFKNPLKSRNWKTATRELGLPNNTPMSGVLSAARDRGHDAVIFENHNGKPEYVDLLTPSRKRAEAPSPASSPEAAQPSRQPWEMTYAELAKTGFIGYDKDGKAFVNTRHASGDTPNLKANHEEQVAKALREGKPVPPEVLADYPDLVRAMPHSQRSPEAVDIINKRTRSEQKASPPESTRADAFLDGMPPMARAKARAALNVTRSNNGEIRTRRAIIELMVDDGAKITTGPSGERRLSRPNGAYLAESQISKTAMDYAGHLIDRKSDPDLAPKQEPSQKAVEHDRPPVAVRMADGTVVSDPEASTHADLIERQAVRERNISETGFIIDGRFMDSEAAARFLRPQDATARADAAPASVAMTVGDLQARARRAGIPAEKIEGKNRNELVRAINAAERGSRALSDRLTAAADAAEKKAAENIKARRVKRPKKPGERSGATTLPQDIVDLATIVAARAVKVGVKGAKSVKALVDATIKELAPHLESQAGRVRWLARRIVKATRDTEGRFDAGKLEAAISDARSTKVAEGRETPRQARRRALAEAKVKTDDLLKRLEVRNLKTRLRAEARASREGAAEVQRLHSGLREEARRLVEEHLPRKDRGVFLRAVAEAHSFAGLRAIATRVRKRLAIAGVQDAFNDSKRLRGKKLLAGLEPEQRTEAYAAQGLIDRLREWFADDKPKSIEDLERVRDELRAATNTIRGLIHEQKHLDEVRIRGEVREAAAIRDEITQRLSESKDLPVSNEPGAAEPAWLVRMLRRRTNWDALMQRLDGFKSGGPAGRLFREVLRSRRKALELAQQFQDTLGGIVTRNGYDSLGAFQAELSGTLGTTAQKSLDIAIGPFKRLTYGQAAYLYAASTDQGFQRRIAAGQKMQFRDDPTGKPFSVTQADLDAVAAALPENVRKLVDEAKAAYDRHYFARMSAVNKRLKGYHLTKEPGYWGIKLNRRYSEGKGTPFSWRGAVIRAMEESGFMQERLGPSRTPMTIGDFGTDIINRSKAAATTVAKAETTKLLARTLLHPDMQTAITAKFGKSAVERLERRISLFSGGDLFNEADSRVLRTIQSLWARGKTQLWVPTWARNAIAGSTRVLNEMSLGDTAAAALPNLSKPTWQEFQELKQFSPELRERWSGGGLGAFYDQSGRQGVEAKFTKAMGATLRELGAMAKNAASLDLAGAKKAAGGGWKAWNAVLDSMDVGNFFDAIPAILAYRAFKEKAPPNLSEDGKKRWAARHATRVFERVSNTATIEYANDVQLDARESLAIAMFIPFTGDTAKAQNMLYEAWQKGPKAFVRTTGVLALGAVLSGIVTGLWKMAQGDDKEKAGAASARRALQDVFSLIPGLGLLASKMVGPSGSQTPEVDLPILEVINDGLKVVDRFYQAYDRMGKPERARVLTASQEFWRGMREVAGVAGDVSGLPIGGYFDAAKAAWGNWKD